MNVNWERIHKRGGKAYLAILIGTVLGCGLVPIAPGTLGSLFGLPLAYFSIPWELSFRLGFWVFLTFLGTWAAYVIDETLDSSDNQSIVIDEVVGIGIATWTSGQNWGTLFAAFILFRIFDILKPPPVRQIDRWSKKQAAEMPRLKRLKRWISGFGVMADDIVAGFQALLIIAVLQYYGWLPE